MCRRIRLRRCMIEKAQIGGGSDRGAVEVVFRLRRAFNHSSATMVEDHALLSPSLRAKTLVTELVPRRRSESTAIEMRLTDHTL
jgi:hypothetical protein